MQGDSEQTGIVGDSEQGNIISDTRGGNFGGGSEQGSIFGQSISFFTSFHNIHSGPNYKR